MRKILFYLVLFVFILNPILALGESWSFCAFSDNRDKTKPFIKAIKEIKEQTVNPEPKFPKADFAICNGDFDPVASNYSIWKTPEYAMPPLYLALGNHEYERPNDVSFFNDTWNSSNFPNIQFGDGIGNYYFDWKNVRMIIINPYSQYGSKDGNINQKGRDWVESLITSSAKIDHVFIAFHEPVFPRNRHIGDSLDQFKDDRNAFWNMIVRHQDKVKAVFVSHTHTYNRMKVKDPMGPANDGVSFPNELDGIYQIDTGAAGNGERLILVWVKVDGQKISFRVEESRNNEYDTFRLQDSWEL